LDEQANWKLIESNSIAAGMGPLSEALQEVLSDTQTPDCYFPPNNAAQLQAKAIADCASNIAGREQTNVVFVIEADEDNIFDQGKLAEALTALGVRVMWKTLSELRSQLSDKNHTAVLTQDSEVLTVHGIYFRTGYNLKDYGDNDKEQQKNLAFRGRLERLDLALCPTISHQLATNKWIQAQLSDLSIDHLINEFSLTTQEAILAQLSLKVPYAKTTERTLIESHLKTGEWVWKQQGEGGGNVKTSTKEARDDELVGSVLMKKIKPMPRRTAVEKYVNAETIEIKDTVSELGFFTVGDSQDYGGYLLRTKPCSALETGVHKGFGMIETVQITQRC
jgi:hypothetical protein